MNLIQVPVSYSDDISELLNLALENLDYDNESTIRYSFLIEEALMKWKESGLSERELKFSRSDNKKDVLFTWEVEGEACDPFVIDAATSDTDCITRMKDMLLSGVGSEIRYKYKRGTNIITLCLPKTNHTESLFKQNLILLAIPLALQSLMATVATYVDSFMVGFLDVNAMSAVSQLSQFIITHSLLIMACETAATVIITKLWGKRDREQMGHTKSIALLVSMLISVFFWAASFFAPKTIMSFYTDIPELMPFGVSYLKTISFSFLITGAYRMYYCFMRITGQTKACMRFSIYACILNIICNSVFIFGLLGIPKLGAFGAALSTVLSALLQFILVLFLARKDANTRVNWFFSQFRSPVVGNFFNTYLPIAAQYIAWCIATNIIASAFGHMNADILAANSILVIITSLISSIKNGIASGGAIMIGDLLGKNKKEKAWKGSRVIVKMTVWSGLVSVGLTILFSLAYTMLPVNMSAEAIQYIYLLIVVYSVNLFFGYLNGIIIESTLYAGGEAKNILLIDSIIMWGILVPIAIAGTYFITIPAFLFLTLLKLDEPLSFPFKYQRYRCRKWLTKGVLASGEAK